MACHASARGIVQPPVSRRNCGGGRHRTQAHVRGIAAHGAWRAARLILGCSTLGCEQGSARDRCSVCLRRVPAPANGTNAGANARHPRRQREGPPVIRRHRHRSSDGTGTASVTAQGRRTKFRPSWVGFVVVAPATLNAAAITPATLATEPKMNQPWTKRSLSRQVSESHVTVTQHTQQQQQHGWAHS